MSLTVQEIDEQSHVSLDLLKMTSDGLDFYKKIQKPEIQNNGEENKITEEDQTFDFLLKK